MVWLESFGRAGWSVFSGHCHVRFSALMLLRMRKKIYNKTNVESTPLSREVRVCVCLFASHGWVCPACSSMWTVQFRVHESWPDLAGWMQGRGSESAQPVLFWTKAVHRDFQRKMMQIKQTEKKTYHALETRRRFASSCSWEDMVMLTNIRLQG